MERKSGIGVDAVTPRERASVTKTLIPDAMQAFQSIISRALSLKWTRKETLCAYAGDVCQLAEELREIAEVAYVNRSNLFDYVISFVNFLSALAYHNKMLPETLAKDFLKDLVGDFEAQFLRTAAPSRFVLKGPRISTRKKAIGDRIGVSMISLTRFQQYYGLKYGFTLSSVDRLKIWELAKAGSLAILADDLRLDGRNHCIWFADERILFDRAKSDPEQVHIDANKAYDLLGLDWRDRRVWENFESPDCRAKALMLRCSLSRRGSAARGLRVPTPVDAWGNMLWTPPQRGMCSGWPRGGGRTLNPQSGRAGLPEGVHGPIVYRKPYDEDPVEAIGEVTGRVRADLRAVCGDAVRQRAIKRLTHAVSLKNARKNRERSRRDDTK